MTRISSRPGPIRVSLLPLLSQPHHSSATLASRPDLFANGQDFSWNTIQNGRNAFYQKQLAQQITTQTKETTALLTAALKVHLNLGQQLLMNTSSIFVSMETVSINSLTNRTIQPMNNAHIRLPTAMLDPSNNQTISLRVRSSSHQNTLISSRYSLVHDAATGIR